MQQSFFHGRWSPLRETVVAVAGPVESGPFPQQLLRFEHIAAAVEAALRLRNQDHQLTLLLHASDGTISESDIRRQCGYLLQLGAPGQILVSEEAASDWLPSMPITDQGWVRLRDLISTVRIYTLPPDTGIRLKSLDRLPNNLPPQFTGFVGREKEMATVSQLLTSHRLVTLTGPGGAGKTRLSLQTAAALVDRWEDGAWFVPLAGASDQDSVAQAAAAAVGFTAGLRETPSASLFEAMMETYADRRFLLILDNCEHLVADCAAWVRTLLSVCRHCTVLCTSREPLGVPGEVCMEVPSLPPDEARRLFLARGRAALPSFDITSDNARAIAEICQRLDGLPLALELAAARVRLLPPRDLARRLQDRFRLLTGGDRLAMPRHQTLRAVVDWSHNLLSEGERTLWRRVSVFAGRFTVEAAVAVCSGTGLEEETVLPLLLELVDKSVVKVEPAGEVGYYRLLETIRQYGLERLTESGEMPAVRQRHLEHYAAWVRQAMRQFGGANQPELFDRLENQFDDLQAALNWSKQDAGSAGTGLSLANALDPFWVVRGHVREGVRHYADLLALPCRERAPTVLGKSLSIAGSLNFTLGDYGKARAYWEQGLMIARELGMEGPIAACLNNLGLLAYNEGKLMEAQPLLTEALAIRRRQGMPRYVANTLINLADLAQAAGNLAEAAAMYEESIALWNALGDSRGESTALLGMATLRIGQRELAAAIRLLSDSLRLANETRDAELCVVGIERAAGLLTTQGRAPAAARLLGAADAQRKRLGMKVWEAERPAFEHDRRATEQGAGEAFHAEFQAGADLGLEAALELALDSLALRVEPSAPAPGGLSSRELEVVQLVAQGLPDKEIAARLYLSKHTVNNHLRKIYGKLGISSRTALTTWAHQHGI